MKLHCERCGQRPALSATRGLCEVCAYREEMGPLRADRQVAAADAERERQKAKRAKVKR